MLDDLKSIGVVMLAALLSAVVGFERERAGKPAGFRTHMFIGGSAALLISVGETLALQFPGFGESNSVRADPLRLMEAIIVGVSFIGAGTILKQTDTATIENLTTAATLLFSAGIGVAVAVGQPLLATGVVLAALFINIVMRKVEDRWLGHVEKKVSEDPEEAGERPDPPK